MVRKSDYPLQVLSELKNHRVHELEVALANAEAALTEAQQEAHRATQASSAFAQETQQLQLRERQRQAVSAGHAQQMERYVGRRNLEQARLATRAEKAMSRISLLKEARDKASSALADAYAARRAIEKHRTLWDARKHSRREAHAQDELDELHGDQD